MSYPGYPPSGGYPAFPGYPVSMACGCIAFLIYLYSVNTPSYYALCA